MAGVDGIVLALSMAISLTYFSLLAVWVYVLFYGRATQPGRSLPLTLILPFKNEGAHLPALIDRYGNVALDAVFVNDGSTDLTGETLATIFANSNVRLLHLPAPHKGKKAAIHHAAEQATCPWILTTDADTRLRKNWLESFQIPEGPLAFVLPIAPSKGRSMWNHFFALEFIALQVAGCASAKMHLPLLANGAAFLYHRETYLASAAKRTDWQVPSGDDVFTLHAIASCQGNRAISAITHCGPVAEADFPEGMAALWRQRLRWVGKAGHIKAPWYVLVSFVALFSNGAFVLAIWQLSHGGSLSWAAVAMIKIVGDMCLLGGGVLYFRRPDLLWYILPAMLVYPFYVLALVATSLWHRPKWK